MVKVQVGGQNWKYFDIYIAFFKAYQTLLVSPLSYLHFSYVLESINLTYMELNYRAEENVLVCISKNPEKFHTSEKMQSRNNPLFLTFVIFTLNNIYYRSFKLPVPTFLTLLTSEYTLVKL